MHRAVKKYGSQVLLNSSGILLVSSWWWSHPLDIQNVSDEYKPYIMIGSPELVIHGKQLEINAN
jgi:hypothetical protein